MLADILTIETDDYLLYSRLVSLAQVDSRHPVLTAILDEDWAVCMRTHEFEGQKFKGKITYQRVLPVHFDLPNQKTTG